jgi:hypothetical protein
MAPVADVAVCLAIVVASFLGFLWAFVRLKTHWRWSRNSSCAA